jgi:hypothetical protein
MRFVHTNERGKYATAVYYVAHSWVGSLADLEAFVPGLFPRSWGHNASAWGLGIEDGVATYWVLISNSKQTTPNDIERRLRGRFPGVRVVAVCAVPGRGGA